MNETFYECEDDEENEVAIPEESPDDHVDQADDEEDDNGLPLVVSIRTGGGWDVTLTLPDGRRTTFAFTPFIGDFHAEAQWTPPPDVHATLIADPPGSEVIEYFPSLYWQQSDNLIAPSTFDNHDIPGWILQTQDGTKYKITRGTQNNVVFQPDASSPGHYIEAQTYGPPKLTSIVQRTGDEIHIAPEGLTHWANGTNLTLVGANANAARTAGIRVKRTKLLLFVVSGVVSALAGILYTFRLSTAVQDNGIGLELSVVTVVLLGGVSIFGGRGTIIGVVLAIAVFAGLQNALFLTNFEQRAMGVVTGSLLLLSVLLPNISAFLGRGREFLRRRELGAARAPAREAAS